MRLTKATAICSVATLALLIGFGVWFVVSQSGEPTTVRASELVDTIQSDVADISVALTNGQIFYYKTESFQTERAGPQGPTQYPSHVVFETWLKIDSSGLISNSATSMRDTDGTLLQYAIGNGSTLTQTDAETGDSFVFDLAPDATTLNEWLQASTTRPQQLLTDDDYEFVGRGKKGDANTVIFEYEYNAGVPTDGTSVAAGKVKLEFVEADPLLNSETHYVVGDSGGETMTETIATVEYQVLEEGSAMPTFP